MATVKNTIYRDGELDRRHGLDLLDFGARLYDPARVAFTTVDPLSEKTPGLSPYTFCAANPIRNIDPTGRKIKLANTSSGSFKNNFALAVNHLHKHNRAGMLCEIEKRVITGSEQKTGRALKEIGEGEVTRMNHYGQGYKTIGPTTTERDYSDHSLDLINEIIVTPSHNFDN